MRNALCLGLASVAALWGCSPAERARGEEDRKATGGAAGTAGSADSGAGGALLDGASGGGAASTGGVTAGTGGNESVPRLDPVADEDGDGITNGVELGISLDPESHDSDDDGLPDDAEVGADALHPTDSDGDGIIDALESRHTDNDLDGTKDPTDAASGWQVASGRFHPGSIANNGSDRTTVEVRLTNAKNVRRVALWSSPDFYDRTVGADVLLVDGTPLGTSELELFDDGTHGDRFAGDQLYSRGNITTNAAIRSAVGSRGVVMFQHLKVTTPSGEEVRLLGIPAENGQRLQNALGYQLGVVDKSALVAPVTVKAGVQSTPHLLNVADPKRALFVKRELLSSKEKRDDEQQAMVKVVLDLIPGDVDFVVAFPESAAFGTHAGFNRTAMNDVQGIGRELGPSFAGWGAENGKFRALLVFNWSLYIPFNHEVAHTWGVHLSPTLGFNGGSHWGAASTNGVLGGFDPATFVDNKNGTYNVGYFSDTGNDWQKTTFSPAEQYLMGLVPASAVPPITILENAERVGDAPNAAVIKATLRTVKIDDIIATHGPRIPDSAASQKHFTAACVVFSERLLTPGEMAWFETLTAGFAAKTLEGDMSFAEATQGKATLDTALPKLNGG